MVLTHQFLDRERLWDVFALEVKLVNVAVPEALCLVLPENLRTDFLADNLKVNVLVLLPCKGSAESNFFEFVHLKVPDRSSLELDALARYVDGERHLLALSVLPDRLLLDGSPVVVSRRAGWRKCL